MKLTNQETQKILLAANPEEVHQILAGAEDIAAWNGAEPLTDHAKCFYDALSQYTEERRNSCMSKQMQLESLGDGSVRFEFFGALSDEELDNVSGGCGGDSHGGAGKLDKPVIYLYPEKETEVTVEVALNNAQFTCVYPAMEDGRWKVTAKPDGTLTADGMEYNYLYWEGEATEKWEDMRQGFCVAGKDTATFFEKSLVELGLTRREANEMIVYWLPLLQNNPYNLISFQFETYNALAHLHISPAPDTLIRVYFVCKPLQKPIDIEPQKLSAPERKGFTVVEWGGTLLK